MFMKKEILEHGGNIVAVITGVASVLFLFLKFFSYVYCRSYLYTYNIDMVFYNFNDLNFFFDLAVSFIFFGSFYIMCYSINDIIDKIFDKNYKDIIKPISAISVVNIVIVIALNLQYGYDIKSFILSFIFLWITEIISAILSKKIIKKDVKKELNKNEKFKFLLFYIVALILLVMFWGVFNAKTQNRFKTINDKYVVLYSTSDYYVIQKCEINDKEITIYTDNYEKISTDSVKVTIRVYDKLTLQE